ncbi:DUF418 domain-containing protein [Rhodocytophaga rosea]|uniref:DUF418 domain-containing protein n=1 Tax=Rhodocytophaga rosea TaxID=2704465 RepID=A0A6C0GN19_9BACT|nr:DUF418 domain-containing protein [Rhodocytophaga rosea]QHT69438.1 DUF418 domain-containing protein [Rhodocytophaga rosea]
MATFSIEDSAENKQEIAFSTGAPLKNNDRLLLLDSIRGIALLGILLMNIPFFAASELQSFNLAIMNEFSGPNYYTWWVVNGLFEGTMRGLFSILFGAGCLLLIFRLERNNKGLMPADIYYRRLLWLLAFGLFNAFVLLWPGDILYPYALCGMLIFPFRNLSVKQLFLVFGVVLAITIFRENKPLFDRKEMFAKGREAEQLEKKKTKLTDEQKKHLEEWQGFVKKASIESIRKESAKLNKDIQTGSYSKIFSIYKELNIKLETTGFYLINIWDILLLMFLGMILFKTGYLTGESSIRLYVIMALVGYGIGLILNYMSLRYAVDIKFDRIKYTDTWYFNYYEIRRLFHTMGHLSLLLVMYRSGVFNWLFSIMAPVGQMAFTNYLMQSIICGTLFYGYGFALFGKLERFQYYEVMAIIWIFQVIFSNIWLRYFHFGPFEWVWRSLTYGRKQIFLKKETQATALA